MSPRKLTEDDKQEILQLYRNSEATTSTLAKSYEVSSSTISRFLKNQLSSTEYEDLIQQKRLARTPRGEKSSTKKEEAAEKTTKARKTRTRQKSVRKTEPAVESIATKDAENAEIAPDEETAVADSQNEASEAAKSEPVAKSTIKRRRRRRSSASTETEKSPEIVSAIPTEEEAEVEEPVVIDSNIEEVEEEPAPKLIINTKASKSSSLILKSDRVDLEEDDDEDDDDEVDLITLKEMLGEDLEDINDEEDDEDDWDDDNEQEVTYSQRDSSFENIEILPLSQATFPRTCYLVIDRSAELIVKPLADFGDLGEIPQEETRQKTLPVFDNHNIAKRFSHRRERVIKVPDGRMLQKTSRHLQDKGITRLLIDGQIYSLSS